GTGERLVGTIVPTCSCDNNSRHSSPPACPVAPMTPTLSDLFIATSFGTTHPVVKIGICKSLVFLGNIDGASDRCMFAHRHGDFLPRLAHTLAQDGATPGGVGRD